MAKLPKMTPEMAKEEQAFYEKELEEFNKRAARMKASGKGMQGSPGKPPKLNPDGSLKDVGKDDDE